MKLFNTLSKAVEPVDTSKPVGIYSCGPTVYNHVHIGNLVSFIVADVLRRTAVASGADVTHVMNYTDIDDKTIKASRDESSESEPMAALKDITRRYEKIFLDDMERIGNDNQAITYLRATEHIDQMQQLIVKLHKAGIAYLSDDGVYFSIERYKASGKTYGQLVDITEESTGAARVDNDEYDKDNIHDFALWKKHKEGEPAWNFEIDGVELSGRPGWHIECSAMSVEALSQPFTVHTGGVDLAFPHHENEIAQSTGADGDILAEFFVHNEHLLVDGKKMSKSLGNFFTLADIIEKGYDPIAFRVLTLQGHYRKQTNFSWTNLESAQNWLLRLRNLAELRWQPIEHEANRTDDIASRREQLIRHMEDDLDSPKALAAISDFIDDYSDGISPMELQPFVDYLSLVDQLLGLQVMSATPDIENDVKQIIEARNKSRSGGDYEKADELRDELKSRSIEARDYGTATLWQRNSY